MIGVVGTVFLRIGSYIGQLFHRWHHYYRVVNIVPSEVIIVIIS